jgi:uncharacterized protein YraI
MRNGTMRCLFVFTAGACLAGAAPADTARPATADEPYIAVVTAADVYVRSGPAASYYPIGKVHSGELVLVSGERFHWARIAAAGPTFRDHKRFFGYIVHPVAQPGRFRLEDDGRTGTTLGRTDVLGPNFNTRYDPGDSWKPLTRLGPNERVTVLETFTAGNNTVHRIVLPEQAEAWISVTFLRPATAEEKHAWNRVAEKPADQSTEQPPAQAKRETPAAPAEEHAAGAPAPQPASPGEPAAPAGVSEQPVLPRERQAAPEVTEAAPAGDAPHPPVPVGIGTPGAAASAGDSAHVAQASPLSPATLDELEAAYQRLRGERTADVEVEPLRRMYLDLASRHTDDRRISHFANTRAEQLRLWWEVQQRQHELQRIRARARITTERAEAARQAVYAAADYSAVGRLSVSTIYDGRHLPRLFRLVDAGTGRTTAYLQPTERFDLVPMLDQLIGVVGDRAYDGGLRLNIITPQRVDILAPAD